MESEAISTCDWHSAYLLIFSENVAPFTYYTHLLPLVVSLVLGGFVLYNNRHGLANRILFFITFIFSVWVYFDLILWASPSPEHVMFFWSSIVPIEMLMYASCLYLVSVFANGQKDISLWHKISIGVFFIPIVLFTHTPYNVLGLSPDCDEGAIEGALIQYMYVVELLFIVWTAFIVARGLTKLKDSQRRWQLALIGVGTILFLMAFSAGNITLVLPLPSEWEQYKLLGMPIFAGFVAYCVVRFKAFDSKAIGAEVLVVALAIATLSLLFLRQIATMRIIAAFTFVLVCVLGFALVRSVRSEVEQRERIEKLAAELEKSNKQQVALIHFITHQLKGFMAKSRMIFSMALEGDFGPVPDTMKPMMQEGFASATKGAQTISEILNASNIKSGRVVMAKDPFDFKVVLEGIITMLKPNADLKNVALTLAAPETPVSFIGDRMQMENALKNLIDNSIKYTPSGKIDVHLAHDGSLLRLTISDTGVGITPEDMQHLFTEGGHGAESRKVNVESTGFGLYIVKNIIEAHKGRVWAESEGKGKGAKFTVELPHTAS